jgi:dihydrodipicolinate reductase
MTNIIVLGANGRLARNTTRVLLRDTGARLAELATRLGMESRQSLGLSTP